MYDHQFKEKYSDGLICLICLCVARDPLQIICCGKLFCRACLKEYKKGSSNCPQCRVHIRSFTDKKSNTFMITIALKKYDIIIPQVNEISFHSKLCVITHLTAEIGMESYAHWMSTWQAVTSLSCHALTNAAKTTLQLNSSAKTWRDTKTRSAQGDSTSVLTAKRPGSTRRGQPNTLMNVPWWRYLARNEGAQHI